ncbi:response regulator [Flavobacteriaceae bacterium R38]|nr:response regulator [Flavobacteriaceae bacterium R38]
MNTIVIVDDEQAGRQLIKEYLSGYDEFQIVGEAENGIEAVQRITELSPDLVFLDIQMPGFTGFEVLSKLEEIPQIIFSTAYDEYALKAFEVHALDFLLKPYTKERFDKAMQRILISQDQNNMLKLVDSLMAKKQNYQTHILIKKRSKLITVAVEDIIWIEAFGDYAKLHTVNGDIHVSNFGVTTLQEKLNPSLFLRVHRSSIVNISHILELEKHDKTYTIRMKNQDIVRVSRSYANEIKKLVF